MGPRGQIGMKLERESVLGAGKWAAQGSETTASVSVRVDGPGCPFCVYGIEKRLKVLDGVDRGARIVTSIDQGAATFPWKAGVAFDPDHHVSCGRRNNPPGGDIVGWRT